MSDHGDMTDTTRTRTPRLERSREDRILAGVSGGLGAHLGINAWWLRLAFIILAFFGGFGVLLYIAAWLVIPDKGYKDPVISQWLRNLDMSDGGTIFGVVLVGAAALIVLTQFADFSGTLVVAAVLFIAGLLLYRGDLTTSKDTNEEESTMPITEEPAATTATVVVDDADVPPAPPAQQPPVPSEPDEPPAPKPPKEKSVLGRITIAVGLIVVAVMALIDLTFTTVDIEPFHYFAAAVGVVGVGLVVGAFIGRALWLIIVGVLLLPVMWLATLAPSTWDFSAGEFLYEPQTVAEVERSIDHGVGQVILDLTSLSRDQLSTVGEMNVDLGAGELIVRLPLDVGATINAEVGLGEITGPFESRTGVGLEVHDALVGSAPSVLTLHLEVGAGVINISGPQGGFLGGSSTIIIEGSSS